MYHKPSKHKVKSSCVRIVIHHYQVFVTIQPHVARIFKKASTQMLKRIDVEKNYKKLNSILGVYPAMDQSIYIHLGYYSSKILRQHDVAKRYFALARQVENHIDPALWVVLGIAEGTSTLTFFRKTQFGCLVKVEKIYESSSPYNQVRCSSRKAI